MKTARLNCAALALTAASLLTPLRAHALTSPADTATTVGADAEALLAVSINGREQSRIVPVLKRADGLYVRSDDLAVWGIRAPDAPTVTVNSESFVPVTALSGVDSTVDDQRQLLKLMIEPARFRKTMMNAAPAPDQPSPVIYSGFLNYNVDLSDSRGAVMAGAMFEAGFSGPMGLFISSAGVGQLTGSGLVRLDSYFEHDNPANLTRLIVGDTLTQASAWTQSVRYGGVRYGTDFSLQPSLLTYPIPTLSGRAVVPSTVALYVNNVLRYQGETQPGDFAIDQAPLVTGGGQVTMVVRDPLGVEHQVTSSYYVSPQLLKPGLSDYSFEAGAERENYGIDSFNYGYPFVAGGYRRGITDWLTLEGRTEIGAHVRDIGAGADMVWPSVGEFSLAAAASSGPGASGAMFVVGFSHVSPRWNLALSYQGATSQFTQIGYHDDSDRIRSQAQVTGGLTFGALGSASVSYTDLSLGDGSRTQIESANYSVSLRRAYLNLFALHTTGNRSQDATTVGMGVTVPLGGRSSAYAQISNGQSYGEVRADAPSQGGWGYRLGVGEGQLDQQQADVTWRGQPAEITLQGDRTDGVLSGRLLASGGLVFAGGGVFATREIDGAYGLVETPGEAHVPVYQDNRLVTTTDAQGRALISDLRPYETNKISVDPSALPIDAKLQASAIQLAPPYLGASVARFDTGQRHPGTLVIQLTDGRPIEAGTPVVDDAGDQLVAGYGGEVFVEHIHAGMWVKALRPAGACRATLETAPSDHAVLPRLGPLECRPEPPDHANP